MEVQDLLGEPMRDKHTKQKGSEGEYAAMLEASRRSYVVLTPHGDFSKYDFVVERNGKFEKVQVKSVTPVDGVLQVPTKTMTFDTTKNGNNRSKHVVYKIGDFDWLIVYDLSNQQCYFLPADKVVGKTCVTLRLQEAKKKDSRIVYATQYKEW